MFVLNFLQSESMCAAKYDSGSLHATEEQKFVSGWERKDLEPSIPHAFDWGDTWTSSPNPFSVICFSKKHELHRSYLPVYIILSRDSLFIAYKIGKRIHFNQDLKNPFVSPCLLSFDAFEILCDWSFTPLGSISAREQGVFRVPQLEIRCHNALK